MCQNINIRFNSYILEVYHTSYFDWFEKKKNTVFLELMWVSLWLVE